ncbi:MAG: tetratricopeptide repeat protein, partial [Proteobacteria bacterium]|nr:tetratricopeptide repeat protein [Pseudomonadota bacterium]
MYRSLPARALAGFVALSLVIALPLQCNPLWAAENARFNGLSPALTVTEVVRALQPDLDKIPSSVALARALEALQLASKLKLPQASKSINEALQLDTRNSYLHFFNGLIYHLLAHQGDTEKTDTAIEGYQQAVRFDPNNWIAHEFLGLAFIEQGQYMRAQTAFAEVLLA